MTPRGSVAIMGERKLSARRAVAELLGAKRWGGRGAGATVVRRLPGVAGEAEKRDSRWNTWKDSSADVCVTFNYLLVLTSNVSPQ